MTRYAERLDEVRSFLGNFDLPQEKVERLLSCKCWFWAKPEFSHAVFRTRNEPDAYYDQFTIQYWSGNRESRGFWTS